MTKVACRRKGLSELTVSVPPCSEAGQQVGLVAATASVDVTSYTLSIKQRADMEWQESLHS